MMTIILDRTAQLRNLDNTCPATDKRMSQPMVRPPDTKRIDRDNNSLQRNWTNSASSRYSLLKTLQKLHFNLSDVAGWQ